MISEFCDYEPALREAVVLAARSRPSLQLCRKSFAQYLSAKLAQSRELGVDLAALHVADLYLAFGCLEGNDAALTELYRSCQEPVQRVLARFRQSTDLTRDVWHEVFARLVFPEAGQAPRLATYAGRGALTAWVTVSARRLASTLLKRRNKESSFEADAGDIEGACANVAHPLKEQYRERAQAVLRAALAQLSPRDRHLLQLHSGGYSFHDIGQMHGVDKSTVFHWFRRIRETLRSLTKAGFASNIRDSELASILRMVRSQLELGLSAVGDDP